MRSSKHIRDLHIMCASLKRVTDYAEQVSLYRQLRTGEENHAVGHQTFD